VVGLYLITDSEASAPRSVADVVAAALAALPPGAAWVQLRDKQASGSALLSSARELVEIVRARDCRLLINDRVDVALAAGADGVHLPENGFDVAAVRALAPGLLVGVSAHGPAPVAGADFAVCGPIWPTPSKARYGAPLGPGVLAEAKAAAPYPVLAIGGIDSVDRARAALAAGADGVACIRAIMSARDPGAAARAVYEAIQ